MFSSRLIAACSFALVLSACGGGGGGGSTGGGSTVVTPPTPGGANMAQQSVQRADVQNSLAGVQAVREYSGGNATVLLRHSAALKAAVAQARRVGMFSAVRPLATAAPTSAPGCSNGSTSSSVAGPNGSVVITVSTYYDSLCTQIENTIVWTATQNGDIVSGPATVTVYSTSGAVTESAAAQITFVYNGSGVLTGLSLLFTNIQSNGQSQGELALGCSAATSASTSCGVALAANVYSSSLEDGANVSFTAASTSSGSTLSMQASSYVSALDGLTISAAQFPDWSITPSSAQIGSVAISGSETASAVSLTVTDSTNGGSVAITGSPNGAVSGSVTRTDTGASVATFTIDASGNGTATYGNGTQVPIVNYAVQG